jgi:signal peptidase I
MENTLMPWDRIVINKLAYRFGDIKHGDIIVFKCPVASSYAKPRDFIKRVIGLPGDTITLRDGNIIRNDKILEENYLKEPMEDDLIYHAHYRWNATTKKRTLNEASQTIVVPEGQIFAMGDNRNNSQDSRYWGFLPQEDILGKAMVIYWPFSRISLIK